MKNIISFLVATIALFTLNSCIDEVDPLDTNYITFAEQSYSTGVDVGSSTTVEVKIFTANITSSARTFNVSVDADNSNAAAGSYTVPTSVLIPASTNEAILSVELSDVNLGIGVNNLVLKFDSKEGLSIGEATTISYIQNCNEVTATLDLSFDRWGSEVYWEILDALDGVVASTNGYPDTGAGTTTTDSVTITLCVGRTYTFFASDGYGDGWGDGSSYTLTIDGVVKVSGDGSGLSPDGVSTAFDTN